MTWYVGATPYIPFKVYDRDGALVDPTALVVSIYDPNGLAMITDAAVVKISTGYYYYAAWTITATHVTGTYKLVPKSTDAGIVIRNTAIEFQVEQLP